MFAIVMFNENWNHSQHEEKIVPQLVEIIKFDFPQLFSRLLTKQVMLRFCWPELQELLIGQQYV